MRHFVLDRAIFFTIFTFLKVESTLSTVSSTQVHHPVIVVLRVDTLVLLVQNFSLLSTASFLLTATSLSTASPFLALSWSSTATSLHILGRARKGLSFPSLTGVSVPTRYVSRCLAVAAWTAEAVGSVRYETPRRHQIFFMDLFVIHFGASMARVSKG